MVWIPVQPDGITLRRWPMVTFSLLGLLTLGQLWVSFGTQNALRQSLLKVVSFNANRTYLNETPEIRALTQANIHTVNLFPEAAGSDKAQAIAQQELDALTKAFDQNWHQHLRYRLSFRPPFHLNFTWISYAFFCGSFLIYIWNLFFIYVCSPVLEDRWGRTFFIAFIALAILLGALGHSFHAKPTDLALSGSGALVGAVLGAYAVVLDHRRIVIRPIFSRLDLEVLAPAWSLLLVWLFGVFFLRFVSLGGLKLTKMSLASSFYPFGFGLLTAATIHFFRLEKMLYKSPFDQLPEDQKFQIRIERELRTGVPEKAFSLLLDATKAFPNRLDFLQPCWDQAIRIGKPLEALHLSAPLLHHYFSEQNWEQAWFLLKELEIHKLQADLPAQTVLDWAQQVKQSLHPEKTPSLFLSLLRTPPRSAGIINQVMQLATDSDPKEAMKLLRLWQTQNDSAPGINIILAQWVSLLVFEQKAASEEEGPEPIPIANMSLAPDCPQDPFAASAITSLKSVPIQPQSLTKDALVFLLPMGKRKTIPRNQIAGLAAAVIRTRSGETEILLDIHHQDPWGEAEMHSCLRILSSCLDPESALGQRLVQGSKTWLKLGQWLSRENPRVLPEFDLFLQDSLPEYASIQDFEMDVYGVLS